MGLIGGFFPAIRGHPDADHQRTATVVTQATAPSLREGRKLADGEGKTVWNRE